MKTLLFIFGAACGIIYMGVTQKPCESHQLQLSKEVLFTIESVEKDTFLQSYILSPTERERTKRAKEMFDRKFPKY